MINLFRAKLGLGSFFLLLSFFVVAKEEKFQEEKELDVVNFQSIKKVLRQDGLSEVVGVKKKQVKLMKKEQINVDKDRYNYPSEDDLWAMVSELWLVKNAQVLAWDFDKPDYGLESSYREILESLGFYQKKFKILLLNTPGLVRAALPGSNGEMILVLSVPFIRSLDLSRLEIALFLLEDFFRLEANFFKNNVKTEKMKLLAGSSFYGTKADMDLIPELLINYEKQIYQKGYNFQQQFEITKKMNSYLKAKPELWNVYFRLLGKLQNFLKVNTQYKDYVRLYPSPEMQQKWIGPEEKMI
jgi:hypothetical protein